MMLAMSNITDDAEAERRALGPRARGAPLWYADTVRASSLAFVLLMGCFDVAFGPAAGASSVGAGGAGGAGEGASTTSTGGAGGSPGVGAGGSGIGAAGGCGDEVCNGLDDDCDGFVDEPVLGVGEACGCTWGELDGRAYVACPAPSLAAAECPALTQIVVPQTDEELSFLVSFVASTSLAEGFVGLTQAPGSPSALSGWSWERPGVAPTWETDEPNDFNGNQPSFVENGDEQCASLRPWGLNDQYCTATSLLLLCEAIADECVEGAPCAGPLGCPGFFDCAAGACVEAAVPESCNGLDDDCNGVADDASCGCVPFTDGTTAYQLCGPAPGLQAAHCPTGFALTRLESDDEVSFVAASVPPGDLAFVGLFQVPGSSTPSDGWRFADLAPFEAPTAWNGGEPDDLDTTEDAQEECACVDSTGLLDVACDALAFYVCEEL
jgi:hypothetical protein